MNMRFDSVDMIESARSSVVIAWYTSVVAVLGRVSGRSAKSSPPRLARRRSCCAAVIAMAGGAAMTLSSSTSMRRSLSSVHVGSRISAALCTMLRPAPLSKRRTRPLRTGILAEMRDQARRASCHIREWISLRPGRSLRRKELWERV
jgi:hypothetical protein